MHHFSHIDTMGQDGDMWYMVTLDDNFQQDQYIIKLIATKRVIRNLEYKLEIKIAISPYKYISHYQ